MGTYYHALFCRYGFRENADPVRDLYQSGKRKEASAAVSDALTDAIAICGPAAYCRERLAERCGEGVGSALLTPAGKLPTGLAEQSLRALAPGA